MMREIYYFNLFETLNEISFNDSNNTYFIYNKTKKNLIIRYRDYECIPPDPINITFGECGFKKNYTFNCLHTKKYDNDYFNFYHVSIYPNSIYENFTYFIKKTGIEKLTIISTNFYEYMFDQFLNLSKRNKKTNIIYHCFDNCKKEKIVDDNFSFIPVEKEKEQEYSFDQMYFKLYFKNIF